MIQLIMNTLFSFVFFISAGTILDTKIKFHKFDKKNYRIIFNLKNNESGHSFCIKHAAVENIKKIIRYEDGVQRDIYKVSKPVKEGDN